MLSNRNNNYKMPTTPIGKSLPGCLSRARFATASGRNSFTFKLISKLDGHEVTNTHSSKLTNQLKLDQFPGVLFTNTHTHSCLRVVVHNEINFLRFVHVYQFIRLLSVQFLCASNGVECVKICCNNSCCFVCWGSVVVENC